MNPINASYSQMLPGGGVYPNNMPAPITPPNGADINGNSQKVGKLDGGQSFEDVFNLGVNNLRSSVSEPTGFSATGVSQFISDVDAKAKEASRLRAEVVTGNSANLHRAMIASEEASVSFSLLLEMRNKLLETYQELMRLQV